MNTPTSSPFRLRPQLRRHKREFIGSNRKEVVTLVGFEFISTRRKSGGDLPIHIGSAHQLTLTLPIDAHSAHGVTCRICDRQGNSHIGTCGRWPGEFQEGRRRIFCGIFGVRKEDFVVRLHYLLASPYTEIEEVAGYCPVVWGGWRFTID
jgi:hypothetical protein